MPLIANSTSHDVIFLEETVSATLEFLTDIINESQNLPMFSENNEILWNEKISKIIKDLSLFVEASTLMTKFFLKNDSHALLNIRDSHIRLLFLIKAINQANLKKDKIGVEELIKYELGDNLIQWKINFIPQIKKTIKT